ncbi:hypothetical protein JG687_00015514 [Phytophthora cactorum]|uniref:Uncharacterized protein n=3 Tax=Phytophthora TaxID=4783 RepID=A0A8J5IL53_9STRA|nr:hypothetical protein JG687_00015514 [Phytophthora cactorum]KAG6949890.1 hypothetical protein JG688_00014439 [Phytophthora aleatoria]
MSNEEINLPTIETSDNRVTVCAGQAISDDGACGRPCTLGGARLDDGEFLSSQTRVASIEHDPVAQLTAWHRSQNPEAGMDSRWNASTNDARVAALANAFALRVGLRRPGFIVLEHIFM